jgi:hypothetical protein
MVDAAQSPFSPDYATARSKFQGVAKRAGAVVESLILDVRGPASEDLAIDIAYLGAENPRQVILHSSGIHGVEGFAGSAIQLQLLQELPALSKDSALVIVHVLNPYGMAWLRRVNENNVDLNRNFSADGIYRGAPPDYSKLDSFLNPKSPPSSDFFMMKTLTLILRYGMPALKQTVAAGQYEYPKGLFFGGNELQQGLREYHAFLRRRLRSARSVVAIDVHTGLGKYGEDSLLVDTEEYDRLRPVFGDRVRPLDPQQGPAYRIEGGLPTLLSHALPDAHLAFVGQEFGTYNPIKVLYALRQENRWHQYGAKAIDHPAKRSLKEAFCPDDEVWRKTILRRGREVLSQALSYGMLAANGGHNASI